RDFHVTGVQTCALPIFMGLSLSIWVGLIGAIGSTAIALILGMAATLGKVADLIVTWLIDLFLSVPHLVTLILIAFTLGGGFKGRSEERRVGIGCRYWRW